MERRLHYFFLMAAHSSHSTFLKCICLALLLSASAWGEDLPSAAFVRVDADGMKTEIELRCVLGKLASEPYFCEIVRRVQGIEMHASAIYPRQLENIFARYWLERGEAAGSYAPLDKEVSLTWNWKFRDLASSTPQETSPAETRAAHWLFAILRSWSNFSG